MNKTKWVIIAIAIVILLAGSILFSQFYSRPLGESLALPTKVPLSNTPVNLLNPTLTNEAALLSTPEATSTSTPQPACDGPAIMYIMAVGSDSRGNHYLYGLADIIRIARVDFVTKRVTVLEVPRDLWVKIPEIADHYNITEGKLNQSYLYGNKGLGYYDGPGQGPGLLARTLDLNFNIRPDHYLAINMQTFVILVDALDGLDVYLPYDIDARTADNPKGWFISAGSHHFDGQTALIAARLRPINTFQRANNQSIIMCALKKKILSPAILPKAPELIRGFQKYVQTDLSPEQITQLSCLGQKLEGKDIQFTGFPEEIFKETRKYDPDAKKEVFVLDVDPMVLQGYVSRFNAGTWPIPQDSASTMKSQTQSGFTCP
jgi:LCP family protein required for cell wall assembly